MKFNMCERKKCYENKNKNIVGIACYSDVRYFCAELCLCGSG